MNPRRPVHAWIGGALLSLLVFAASGCVTGERPTLAENRSTGYPDVDDVVERIVGLSDAQYTAHYDVLIRYSNETRAASASQSAGDRRSLTIGDVRYVVHGPITKTCTVSTGACVAEIDSSRVSDVQMTPDFFGTSLAARIELDAARAIGTPAMTVENTEGGEAMCVAIPVTGTTSTYCALANGVLTRLDAADLAVTMTSYSPEVDELLYAEGGGTTSTTAPAPATAAAVPSTGG